MLNRIKKIVMTLFITHTVFSSGMFVLKAEEVGSVVVYTECETTLYEDTETLKEIGNIRACEDLMVEEEKDGWYKVTYAGYTGYVSKAFITVEPPYLETQKDKNSTIYSYEADGPELLYPSSHYFEEFDLMTNIAISMYSADVDTKNDYVMLSNTENIVLSASTISNAHLNGCEWIELQYTENKTTPSIVVKFKPWKAKEDYDLSFALEEQNLTFTSEEFPTEIKIGIALKEDEVIYQNSQPVEITVVDDISWFETDSPLGISIENKKNKEDITVANPTKGSFTTHVIYIVSGTLLVGIIVATLFVCVRRKRTKEIKKKRT